MAPDGDQQPVLEHPLNEDQQNRLAKPAKLNQSLNNNEIENIGHLPVNVRQNVDENNNDALQVENEDDGDGGGGGGLKRKKIPMVNNNDVDDDRDKASEVKFNRDDIQEGARVLNEPKEYPGGIGK